MAWASLRAYPARSILRSVGIRYVSDPDNLVEVSTKMHWFMHTKVYYSSVNAIIGYANSMDGDKEKNVRMALKLIKKAIQIIDSGL